jgi:hypothetical protein
VPRPDLPPSLPDWRRTPVLPSDLNLETLAIGGNPANRPNRIPLFRIQPAFASDPLGLDSSDDPPSDQQPLDPDPGPDWINITYGNDNPYFDFRQRGDPGGLGFYRICTQVQLFDLDRTSCSLALQAVTPAGQENNGLPDYLGPKVVSPGLSVFHSIDEETALQGYVGKHMPLQYGSTGYVQKNLQYGMALQRSLGGVPVLDPLKNLYLSIGALGQYRLDREAPGAPMVWEVLPGLHWKMADNCWVSGGMILPVGSTRTDAAGHWQVTFKLRY